MQHFGGGFDATGSQFFSWHTETSIYFFGWGAMNRLMGSLKASPIQVSIWSIGGAIVLTLVSVLQPATFTATATVSAPSQAYMKSVEQVSREEAIFDDVAAGLGFDPAERATVVVAQPINTPELRVTVTSTDQSVVPKIANEMAKTIAGAATDRLSDGKMDVEISVLQEAVNASPEARAPSVALAAGAGLLAGSMIACLLLTRPEGRGRNGPPPLLGPLGM